MFDFVDLTTSTNTEDINSIEEIKKIEVSEDNAEKLIKFIKDEFIINDPKHSDSLAQSLCMKVLYDIKEYKWLEYMIGINQKNTENYTLISPSNMKLIKGKFKRINKRDPGYIETITGLNEKIDTKSLYKKPYKRKSNLDIDNRPKKKRRVITNSITKQKSTTEQSNTSESNTKDNQTDKKKRQSKVHATKTKQLNLNVLFVSSTDQILYDAIILKRTDKQIKFTVPEYDNSRKFIINTTEDSPKFRHREGYLIINKDLVDIPSIVELLKAENQVNEPVLCKYCNNPIISIGTIKPRYNSKWMEMKCHRTCYENVINLKKNIEE